jgi:Outer membrane protein beta-barrel domain
MRKAVILTVALALSASALSAQSPRVKPEIRPFAGAVIPTGELRNLFLDAPMFGVSTAAELKPTIHVLATFMWAPAQDKYGLVENNVNIFQYTAGAELGFVTPLAGSWELRPFAGLGVGGRTYAFQGVGRNDRTDFVGYGAIGTEFQIARTALRLEVRDNVFGYRSPIPRAGTETLNDIGVSLGVAYHLR